MDLVVPVEDLLEHELRLAVGVDRLLGQALVHGDFFRGAVGGAGGGEDEFLDARIDGGVEEVDASGDVIAEIFRGVGHRLGDEGVGGEVHDGFGLGFLNGGEDLVAVSEVAFDEFGARVEREAVALGEVVENGDLMAGVEEFLRANTADVACAAGNENVHGEIENGLRSQVTREITVVHRNDRGRIGKDP